MRSLMWIAVIALVLTACGRTTTAATTAPVAAGIGGPDLSGLNFEVHQEPG